MSDSRRARVSALLALGYLVAACASESTRSESTPKAQLARHHYPMPVQDAYHSPSRTLKEVHEEMLKLMPVLGHHAPRFESPEQRDQTYTHWCDLLADVRGFDGRDITREGRLAQLGLLYGFGNNLDVEGSGQLADDTIAECLHDFPESVACHWDRVTFYNYVPLTDERVKATEQSLDFLRSQPHVKQQEVVLDQTLIYLRIRQGDTLTAKRLIDDFLWKYPDAPAAKGFSAYRAKLEHAKAPSVPP